MPLSARTGKFGRNALTGRLFDFVQILQKCFSMNS